MHTWNIIAESDGVDPYWEKNMFVKMKEIK